MEREILFRGKDNNIKGIDWVYGYYVRLEDQYGNVKHLIYSGKIKYDPLRDTYFPSTPVLNHVDPATVGRYTGMTDKNGKKIFEGDIMTFSAYGMDYIGIVTVDAGNACILCDNGKKAAPFLSFALERYSPEIIGNIHDNPELLEVQG